MAHVSPRYDGIVTGISARLGQSVQAGQVLATLESNDTLAPFRVSSPIEGTIVDFHITMGESVEAGRYLFIVADLTEVWVDLDIYQKDLGRVEKGQLVLVMAGRDELRTEGIIDYVGPVVRESTRTGLARLFLANPDGRWKAGMFVTGRVTTAAPTVPVAIRLSAVQKLEGRPVAFVRTGDEFEPRDLVLGRRDSDFVEVLSGISVGETYVSERSFLLKAHLEKASLDPHSGHNH
jgi:cobalt-zinc-cadmium efflux system membrane fusion protein